MNSPHQHLRKYRENSMENMHIDGRVYRVNLSFFNFAGKGMVFSFSGADLKIIYHLWNLASPP